MVKFDCDKLIICGDLISHDDILTLFLAVINIEKVDAIVISRSGWVNPGAAIRTVGNLLEACERHDVKVFVGYQVDEVSDRLSHIVSSDDMIGIDLMYGGVYDLPNRVIDYSEGFEGYIKKLSLTNRVGVLSLGPMTDISRIIENVDWVIQQGGELKFKNPQTETPDILAIDAPKSGASVNVYLDVKSAQQCLVKGSNKIWWVLSGVRIDYRVNSELIELLISKYPDSDFQRVMKSLIKYYRGMNKLGKNISLSDVSVLLVYLYPNDIDLDIQKENLRIDDDITESITEDGDFFNWNYHISKQIGLMLPGPYETNCITSMNVEKANDLFVDLF